MNDQPLVTIHIPSEIPYSSHFIAGAFDLMHAGRCRVRFAPPLPKQLDQEGDMLSTTVDVAHKGITARVNLDLSDKSYRYSESLLKSSDLYLKRNLVRCEAPAGLDVSKVLPHGLIYPVRSRHEQATFRRLTSLVHQWLTAGKATRATDKLANALYVRRYYRLTYVDRFENAPDSETDDCVLFQTRYLGNEQLNDERAALIRALKRHFQERFIGGFVPSGRIPPRYADCVTTRPCGQREYLALCQRARVNVYSRGHKHSPAWKLGEYFAASSCVVAEPPPTELPLALEHERHWLVFDSIEACVEQCERALTDGQLRAHLRQEAHRYYDSYVRPSAAAQRIISLALAAKSGSSSGAMR